MKIIVAGSRGIADYKIVADALRKAFKLWEIWELAEVEEIVSGCANGVDLLGETWAEKNSVTIKRFMPDWDQHGRAAGPIRNRQMAEYADALVAVWDGKSRGTANMIDTMKRLGKPVYVSELTPKRTSPH